MNPASRTLPPSSATLAARMAWQGMGAALVALMLARGAARAATDQGRPACDYCGMIFDERPSFGAEIVTRSGTHKIYDAVECMAAAVLTDSVRERDIRAILLVDHAHPGSRVPLGRVVFLHCPGLETPMGLSLAAFGNRSDALAACPARGRRMLDWRGVLTHVDTTWFRGKLSVDRHLRVARPPARR